MLACLLADRLPLQVEQQRLGLSLPLIVRHAVETEMVWAASDGIPSGVPVYQAKQIGPAALVLDADEAEYHLRHAALEAALRAFSPALETVALGEFLLDARGLDRLHGSFQSAANAILAACQSASQISLRFGCAANKFTAQQAARLAPRDAALVVPPGRESTFLASLSIDVLPGLPGEMRRRLLLLDLRLVGDLAALPKAAVLRQFGPEMASLYELARGRDPRPLSPDVPPLRLARVMQLPDAVVNKQILRNAVNHLSGQIGRTLIAKGYHAEALKLTLLTESGSAPSAGQSVKPPTSDESRLRYLAAQLLGRIEVTSPVGRVTLSAYPLRSWHLGTHQLALVDAGVTQKRTRLEETIQLLVHRFGEAVLRIAALLGPPRPLPVTVRLNDQGEPAALKWAGEARAVLEINERWRVEKWWWNKAVKRDYYRVLLVDGTLRNIFRDGLNDEWFLDRAWPIL